MAEQVDYRPLWRNARDVLDAVESVGRLELSLSTLDVPRPKKGTRIRVKRNAGKRREAISAIRKAGADLDSLLAQERFSALLARVWHPLVPDELGGALSTGFTLAREVARTASAFSENDGSFDGLKRAIWMSASILRNVVAELEKRREVAEWVYQQKVGKLGVEGTPQMAAEDQGGGPLPGDDIASHDARCGRPEESEGTMPQQSSPQLPNLGVPERHDALFLALTTPSTPNRSLDGVFGEPYREGETHSEYFTRIADCPPIARFRVEAKKEFLEIARGFEAISLELAVVAHNEANPEAMANMIGEIKKTRAAVEQGLDYLESPDFAAHFAAEWRKTIQEIHSEIPPELLDAPPVRALPWPVCPSPLSDLNREVQTWRADQNIGVLPASVQNL